MSHELTQRKNGFVEMAYTGEVPWTKLGQKLKVGAPIEEWIVQAGMDWTIERAPVEFTCDKNMILVPQRKIFAGNDVLFRSDTKEPLAIAGSKYKIVQPAQCLEFFRDLVADNGFTLHTAGTLFGGKKMWALVSINESANIVGQDVVDGFLLLTTSCDGSLATTAKFTTVRVVCNNTLSMALDGKNEVRISHRTDFNHSAVKTRLGIASDTFAKFIADAKRFANMPITIEQAETMTAELLNDAKFTSREDVKESAGFRNIMHLFEHGKGNNGASVWDLLNGVTEYVDHVQRAKSESHRLQNSWYGRGDALKTAALEKAMAL